MQQQGYRHVNAFLFAFRRMIDPHRAVLNESTPYALTGGRALTLQELIGGAGAAAKADADLIHLEFSPGREADGPINIAVGMSRAPNIVLYRSTCRLWLDPRGTPFLVGTLGRKFATMSFDPAGMDSNPGKPKGSLEKGYARADAKLRQLAAEAFAANEIAIAA